MGDASENRLLVGGPTGAPAFDRGSLNGQSPVASGSRSYLRCPREVGGVKPGLP